MGPDRQRRVRRTTDHIALLRELCITRHGWLTASEFEDSIAACNLLPGPASTQLAILCAWRIRRAPGAVVGGLSFILPGLVSILGLSALLLADGPPTWIRGAAAGAGAAVAAVALHAGASLAAPSWRAARRRPRWVAYVVAGAVTAALAGSWVVLTLIASGLCEVVARRTRTGLPPLVAVAVPIATATAGIPALIWVGFKVGALSYGGGFVIVPLMQTDAVDTHTG